MKAFGCLSVWLFLLPALLGADPRLETDQEYLARIGPVTMVVDPDWYPYEALDANGQHVGIAADLVRLIAQRAGVALQVMKTKDWEVSLEASRTGKAKLISFLNQTPKREEWLVFTEPYFTDPNVFVTREEHDFISDPARLSGERVVLPKGTSVEERLRADYPNLEIVLVNTEDEAVEAVERGRAEMTLRSLTMAAYTIKKQGLFNLKIAGQVPGFTNQFRMGVASSEPRLRDLLNQAIATLTPPDVQTAVNNHISVRVQTKVDYAWALGIGGGTVILVVLGLLWIVQLRRLNAALAQREAEKALILREVHHRIKNNLSTIQGLLYLQAAAMPDSAAAVVLADAQHRVQSMMLLYDRIYLTESYGAVSAQDYVSDLVDRILESFPGPPVTVEKDLAALSLSADQLQPLGMILNELLTNVMKYAFRGRDRGWIRVAVKPQAGQVELVLEDDGPGLPASVDFQHSTGFGLQLVGLLAGQLGGSIRVDRERGARVVLVFPATVGP